MLLSILQYIGQPPTTQDYPAPTVNDAGHLRSMRSLSDEKL